MANQSNVRTHFKDVAANYDELYGFVYDALSQLTIEHLQLKPDDLLVDVGAGTGAISHLIWKKAGLNNPVMCVEPSAEMLSFAEKRDGLIPFLGTADAFLASNDPKTQNYNKVLMNECAHLFPNPIDTFRKMADYLPEEGKLVLIVRARTSTFPMWESLREKFTVFDEESFKEMLEKAGFTVRIVQESYFIPMTKGEWYNKLRGRVFSTLYEFSDGEIEEGLKEIDRKWFPNTRDCDVVDIKDTLVYYHATKINTV